MLTQNGSDFSLHTADSSVFFPGAQLLSLCFVGAQALRIAFQSDVRRLIRQMPVNSGESMSKIQLKFHMLYIPRHTNSRSVTFLTTSTLAC